MPWWKLLDKWDAGYYKLSASFDSFLGHAVDTIGWYATHLKVISVLIVVMILVMIGLAWLQLDDRKKLASKAYWRGWNDAKKESNK
jgi:hypothetical protein